MHSGESKDNSARIIVAASYAAGMARAATSEIAARCRYRFGNEHLSYAGFCAAAQLPTHNVNLLCAITVGVLQLAVALQLAAGAP